MICIGNTHANDFYKIFSWIFHEKLMVSFSWMGNSATYKSAKNPVLLSVGEESYHFFRAIFFWNSLFMGALLTPKFVLVLCWCALPPTSLQVGAITPFYWGYNPGYPFIFNSQATTACHSIYNDRPKGPTGENGHNDETTLKINSQTAKRLRREQKPPLRMTRKTWSSTRLGQYVTIVINRVERPPINWSNKW